MEGYLDVEEKANIFFVFFSIEFFILSFLFNFFFINFIPKKNLFFTFHFQERSFQR